MSKSTTNINGLLNTAVAEGNLSPEAFQALTVDDLGAQIQAGLGIDVDDVKASAVVLVTVQPDDSGSIRFKGNAQVLRDGHNLVIESLTGSKQNDEVLFGTRYLNGFVLNPYCPIAQAVKMDSKKNYNPDLGTPLFDNAVLLLGTVMTKAQEFSDNGVPVRTVTLIVSDGNDEGSMRQRPAAVASVVSDMLASENHIIAAMGIDDGHTDFYQVFSGRSRHEVEAARKAGTLESLEPATGGMGIWPRWVLTPGDSQSEIRKAFQVFSQSAVRVSQTGANFSKTAMGGFGA